MPLKQKNIILLSVFLVLAGALLGGLYLMDNNRKLTALKPQGEDSLSKSERIPASEVNRVTPCPIHKLPQELHAKSAIEITAGDHLNTLVGTQGEVITFPLEAEYSEQLQINKVLHKPDGHQVLFGALADGTRSHFSFLFKDGILKSGNLINHETEKKYRISTLDDNSLIVSLNDPTIKLPTCGCAECINARN